MTQDRDELREAVNAVAMKIHTTPPEQIDWRAELMAIINVAINGRRKRKDALKPGGDGER